MDSPFTMVATIVVVVFAYKALKLWTQRHQADPSSADNARLERIEARVSALEEVVSDGENRLREKIDQLGAR